MVRLALIYAAIDNQSQINLAHLEAALAVWSYCEDSAGQIFGDLLGDSVSTRSSWLSGMPDQPECRGRKIGSALPSRQGDRLTVALN